MSPLGPVDAYGRNKLTIERLLSNLRRQAHGPADRNVVGYDRHSARPSFMSMMLGRLAEEGRVVLDVSPFVQRDFLPIEQVAAAIRMALNHDLTGVFNIGSGASVESGVALWVIERFGRGELVISSPRVHDEFVLDVRRLRAATDWYWPAGALPNTVQLGA